MRWPSYRQIFVYSQPIDMRWGFERLLHLVQDDMKHDINCCEPAQSLRHFLLVATAPR